MGVILFLIAISFLPKFLSIERTPFQKNWITYKQQFIESGRVFSDENNHLPSSEGQGFALLFSVFSNDRETFQALWAWTQKNLQREDQLFKQHINSNNEECGDQCLAANDNASNGDIIIAWALLAAENKWDRQVYLVEGMRVLDAIKTKLLRQKFGYQLLLPSEAGFELPDGRVQLNLSYWIFPAFNLFTEVTADPVWDTLYQSGISLMESARFGQWHLPAEWMILSEDKTTLQEAVSAEYTENTNRLALYLMLAEDYQKKLIEPFMNFWTQETIPESINLLTDQVSQSTASAEVQVIKTFIEAKINNNIEMKIPEITEQTDYNTATIILLSQLPLITQ